MRSEIPAGLRSRAAVTLMGGLFLIPVNVASLRGLQHVVTCSTHVQQPFTVVIGGSRPTITSASSLARRPGKGCESVTVSPAVSPDGRGRVRLVLRVVNGSRFKWRGTVRVSIDGTTVPVGIGLLKPGQIQSESLSITLARGAHEIKGRLYIGP